MTHIRNRFFKIFGFAIWEYQLTTITEPEYIETNVTDDSIRLLKRADDVLKESADRMDNYFTQRRAERKLEQRVS